ncbi:MAG: uracil-DNA glycosylase [Candidatus Dormibacteria bacterium]
MTAPPLEPAPALERLHQQILRCRRCLDAGWLTEVEPVLPAPVPAGVVLVGQAPGRVEGAAGRPFSGRAGRVLFSWLARAGLGGEEEARRRIYITSITKCFPGPARGGAGDRRPTPAEVELCRPHLDHQLALLRPWLVLAVGQMALGRFLGARPMDQSVGRVFTAQGEAQPALGKRQRFPLILPLPHPSGASRWLNEEAHRRLLERGLEMLAELLSQEMEAFQAAR